MSDDGSELDADATWSHRKQIVFLSSEAELSAIGGDMPTPISTDSASVSATEPAPEPEPEPEPVQEPEPEPEMLHASSSSSEDEYDAAPPPRQSPTWSVGGASVIGTPASILKRRKGRSTSLETSVVIGGGLHGSMNGSMLSEGAIYALLPLNI